MMNQLWKFARKKDMSLQGFTLIEMLIVIAIVGILASLVLVGLGPVQRRGRDARRLSDLRETQNALELYFNKCGYYPGTAQSGASCGSFTEITDWDALEAALTGSSIGINNIPNDPSSGRSYLYGTDSSGTSYVLGAELEDDTNPALRDDANDSDISFSTSFSCGDPVYCIQF